jgi:NADPH2:quinone reductase
VKAAWFEKFGPAGEVIQVGEFPTPTPGHGEVLVRMKTSGSNPSDTKKRAGAFPNLLDQGPVIPNSDGAGIIEAVGVGVPRSRIGQRVWVYQAQFGRLHGTAAQYLAVDATRAVRLPDNVSFDVGACLGIPVMTAHRCVHADGPVQGQVVLVTGGAGRVGYYAIQFAKLAGATVVATASEATGRQDCFDAGADFVVNHRESDWHEQVLHHTSGRKIDRVVDVEFGFNLPKVLDILRTGGVIATYSSAAIPEPQLPFRRMMFMDVTVRMVIVYAMPEPAKEAAIRDITVRLEKDELQHRIGATFPLDRFADSNDAVEKGGLLGCVVVQID